MDLDDLDNAIRRWWQHERPKIQTRLRHEYNVGSIPDAAMRMMLRGFREAFTAGWNARGRMKAASGSQRSLLGDEDG